MTCFIGTCEGRLMTHLVGPAEVRGLVAGDEHVLALSFADDDHTDVTQWAHPGPAVGDTADLHDTLMLNHDVGHTATCILVRHSLMTLRHVHQKSHPTRIVHVGLVQGDFQPPAGFAASATFSMAVLVLVLTGQEPCGQGDVA
jgi:hypothetical protein